MNFKHVYPGNGKIILDGGKNNKYEKSIIEDNESPDCLNVVFENGSVGTRPGFTKVNTASVGSFVCDGLYTYHGSNNSETMVAFFGGTGWTLAGTSFSTMGSAQSVFTAGVRVAAAEMEGHIFVCNGNVIPYKYNGTDFTRHGVYPPTMTVSFNSNGAGNPNGDYQYKLTYVNSAAAESNPSSASTTFTVASKQIELTSIPVAPQSWGVASRRIYRTEAGGTTFKRVAEISDNTTTTYTDNIADAGLGTTAPTDNGVPPIYSHIVYHYNRLFVIGNDNLVWYSDVNEPYTFGSLSFEPFGDQSFDIPVGLAVYQNSLVVFCKRNIYLWYMVDADPDNWKKIKVQSSFSSVSPYSFFEYNGKLCFAATQSDKFVGFAAMRGNVIEPTSTLLSTNTAGSELKTDRIETDMFDVVESYTGNISSFVFKNKAYISLTKETNQTLNNRIYVMDFSISNVSKNQSEAWVPWTGLNAAQFTSYGGNLYFGSSNAVGYIYKMSDGVYSDDGTAINSYIWTKEFTGPKVEASYNKDFRYANALLDLAGGYFMDVAVRTDSDSGDGTNYQVDLDPNASLWGTMVWGVDDWGGGAYQKDLRLYLAGARGKRIQFKFSNQNTADQRFKIHWLNFTYNLKGPR